ncbi:uncharacterized protein F5147DRAFT_236866 [Suillus discolor]|uniref:Uncharacterized protein n=1 Tax=Suillus discolor TaxID=1912936 RepID=A0A9P7F5I1_9AGAM|nr:uncharacterized protein F5147DRAFT_236866 [Suillus discolor]KAG2105768.1 hypothetical protein F5147DRAFT_236866 [Suillus discolor]
MRRRPTKSSTSQLACSFLGSRASLGGRRRCCKTPRGSFLPEHVRGWWCHGLYEGGTGAQRSGLNYGTKRKAPLEQEIDFIHIGGISFHLVQVADLGFHPAGRPCCRTRLMPHCVLYRSHVWYHHIRRVFATSKLYKFITQVISSMVFIHCVGRTRLALPLKRLAQHFKLYMVGARPNSNAWHH